MSRTLILSLLCLPTAFSFATDRPPNIVIIFIDDLGYSDIGAFGAFGSTKQKTPISSSLATRMTEETGGESPRARRPAGKVEHAQTLYPAQPKAKKGPKAAK